MRSRIDRWMGVLFQFQSFCWKKVSYLATNAFVPVNPLLFDRELHAILVNQY